ncbi:MAG TPA: S41 family peptidase [Candidatus Saccharimonadales bacterium]|nr:S41 family peptidase [Candidatus Saccharimonadales bacterium]
MSDDSQKLFNEQDKEGAQEERRRFRLGFIGKTVAAALVLVLVFGLGIEVGSGRLALYGSQAATGNLPKKLDYSSVNQVYQALKSNYDGQLDANKLLDGIKSGLASATGDPYTKYFSAAQAKDFNNELSGTFTGIGAELGQDSAGHLQVVAPIAGFPAAKAGLRAQDLITQIDGTSTAGMSVDTAVGKIRGPKGTTVKLTIVRDGAASDVAITRDDIKVPSVNYKILPGNVGYMQITQFSDDTAGLAKKAADQFKQAGVKGVVLDMRDNPGGLLTAAVDVSSLWVPNGKMVLQEKRGNTVTNTYNAEGGATLNGIPTAVLVNGGSASAAEITAGALRDNNVARVIGAKSYGKGSVQVVLDLTGGAEMKVTVAKWYRPNGQNIDKKGITPDQPVVMTDSDYKNNQDPQEDAALAWLQAQIKQ